MSRINNHFHLTGHLGAEPQIHYLPTSGEPVARLALAVNAWYRDKVSGERIERVDWFDLTVYFKSLVDVVQNYCHKGTQIQVCGHLKKRVWDSKERKDSEGKPMKESRLELIVSELLLLGKSKGESASAPAPKGEAGDSDETPYYGGAEGDGGFDAELPF